MICASSEGTPEWAGQSSRLNDSVFVSPIAFPVTLRGVRKMVGVAGFEPATPSSRRQGHTTNMSSCRQFWRSGHEIHDLFHHYGRERARLLSFAPTPRKSTISLDRALEMVRMMVAVGALELLGGQSKEAPVAKDPFPLASATSRQWRRVCGVTSGMLQSRAFRRKALSTSPQGRRSSRRKSAVPGVSSPEMPEAAGGDARRPTFLRLSSAAGRR